MNPVTTSNAPSFLVRGSGENFEPEPCGPSVSELSRIALTLPNQSYVDFFGAFHDEAEAGGRVFAYQVADHAEGSG